MNDLEKIQYTKSFIDKLASGTNPMTDAPIPETDLLKHPKISGCMSYVSAILGKISEHLLSFPEPVPYKKRIKNADKQPFVITDEQKLSFRYEPMGVYVGDVVRQLNELVDVTETRKLKSRSVFDWLQSEELVYIFNAPNGKSYRKVTEKGKQFGFFEEFRLGLDGENYPSLKCGKNAQRYIVDNANTIAATDLAPEAAFQGKPWLAENDKQLIELFNDGLVVDQIATELKRTPGAIRARLVRLGLINNRNDVV